MATRVENFEAYQGDKFTIRIEIYNPDGSPVILNDYSFYATARREYGLTTGFNFDTVLIIHAEDFDSNGDPIEDARVIAVRFELPASRTITMKAGRYVYDILQINAIDSNNDREIVMQGIIDMMATATRTD